MSNKIKAWVVSAAVVLFNLFGGAATDKVLGVQSEGELKPEEVATISQCVEQSMAAVESADVWIREEVCFDTTEVKDGKPQGVLLREVRIYRVFLDTVNSRYAWFMTSETSGKDWQVTETEEETVPLESFSWHGFWWEGGDHPLMRMFGAHIMELSRPDGAVEDHAILGHIGFPDPRGIPFRGRPSVRRFAGSHSASSRSAQPEVASGVITALRLSDRIRVELGQKEQQFPGVDLTAVTDYDLESLMPTSRRVILRNDKGRETVFQSIRVDWKQQKDLWLPCFSSHEQNSPVKIGDREEYGNRVSTFEVRWNSANDEKSFPDDLFDRVKTPSLELVNEYIRTSDEQNRGSVNQPRDR